jgi:hypothetical protein
MDKDFLSMQVNDFADELEKKIEEGLLVQFAHMGFSDYTRRTVRGMRQQILREIVGEETPQNQIDELLADLTAIFNDSKNLLLLREISDEVRTFFKKYYLMVQNWNSIVEKESVAENIEAIRALFSVEKSLSEISKKASAILHDLDRKMATGRDAGSQGGSYRASQTFLEALKKSKK